MEKLEMESFIILATIFATELAKGKDIKEITHYKSFFSTVCNTLGTIIVEKSINKKEH